MNPASACAALMPHALLHSSRSLSSFLASSFLLPRRSIMLFIIPHFNLLPLFVLRYSRDVAAVQHEGIQHYEHRRED